MTTRSADKHFINKPKKGGLQGTGTTGAVSMEGEYRDFRAIFLNVEGGAGVCTPCVTAGVASWTFIFEHDPLATKIMRLDFLTNLALFGSCADIACALGPGNTCDTVGSEGGISVGIWYDDTITDAEIDRQTVILGGPWTPGYDSSDPFANPFPGDISQFVTQPKHNNFSRKVYVKLKWSSAGLYLPCGFLTLNFTNDVADAFADSFVAQFRNYQYEKAL